MKHVLIVEDLEVQSSLLSFSINAQGYEVTAVTSGEEALKLLKEGLHVDLITLDIHLIGMNGLQFLSIIRKDPKTKGIPAIIISALSQTRHMDEAKALGIVKYIVKPVNFQELTTLLKKKLDV